MSKVYISGRISGASFIEDRACFDNAQEFLRERGDIAVNPIYICTSAHESTAGMRQRIKALADCDGIYMLKGWRASREARLEHFISLKLNLKIELEK